MRRTKKILAAFFLLLITPGAVFAAARGAYDVVVAGGGIGGIAAAIQAARLGASVLVVEPSGWIGGQATAAGVSTMDDKSRLRSGLYLELIDKAASYYASRGKSMGTCYWEPRSVAFEPFIGQRILLELVESARRRGVLDILHNASITAVQTEPKNPRNPKNDLEEAKKFRKGKRTENDLIVRGVTVRTPQGARSVACKVLIDATEYGDVLPLAGARYRVGNSTSPFINPNAMIQEITWTAVIRKYPIGVPSRLRPRTPLPGYELAKRNYESYVTTDGGNFRYVFPIVLPVNFVTHNAYRGLPDSFTPWNYDASRESWPYITKASLNWGNDYPGTYEGHRGLPAAYLEDPAFRAQVEREALIKTLHFIYYIQNELGEAWSVDEEEYNQLPAAARDLPPEWREVARHMPPIPYVRESRRAVGDYTLTSEELLENSLSYRDGQTSHEFSDAIAIGGYILDLHGAATDADMEWDLGERAASIQHNRPRGPFQVPMRALIPAGVEGLIAAEKNLSMTRLAAGALRLQPICMMTGQAAGALAALSAKDGVFPREVNPVRVQRALLDAGVVLSLCNYTDVPPEHPLNRSVQLSNLYGLIDPLKYPHAPSYNIDNLDDPKLAMAIIKGDDKGFFGVDDLISRRDAADMAERTRAAVGLKGGPVKLDKPELFITRGELARLLYDVLNLRGNGKKGRSPFRPSRHRDPALVEAVEALGPLGVLDVYRQDREFHFGRPVTRGEAADILTRAMMAVRK